MSEEYYEGYSAYESGAYKSDNPYLVDYEKQQYEDWQDGYNEAAFGD